MREGRFGRRAREGRFRRSVANTIRPEEVRRRKRKVRNGLSRSETGSGEDREMLSEETQDRYRVGMEDRLECARRELYFLQRYREEHLTILRKAQLRSSRIAQTSLPFSPPSLILLDFPSSSTSFPSHQTTSRALKIFWASDSSSSAQSSNGGGCGPCGTTVSRRMSARSLNLMQQRIAQPGQAH